jgi:hypothetical protein
VFGFGDLADGLEYFVQQHRVEKSGIQVVTRAVVAQVEAEHVEAAVEQKTARGADIRGCRTALPSMQQNDQSLVVGEGVAAHVTQQANAVNGGQDRLPGCAQHGVLAPRPQSGAGQQGLNTGRLQQKGWI